MDHPRACGANGARQCVTLSICGSSPRMRGKLTKLLKDSGLERIIPAHAGQTDGGYARSVAAADHPRACGANAIADEWDTAAAGSSPRMRGKRWRTPDLGRRWRIIPAHAGQTGAAIIPTRTRTDHPRACGANPCGPTMSDHVYGSSPRMRGKH